MCTVPLPPGIYPIAVDKYIISSYHIINNIEGMGCLKLILHTAYACVKLERTLDILYMKLKRKTHLNVLEKYQICSTLEQNFHLGDNGIMNVIVTLIF